MHSFTTINDTRIDFGFRNNEAVRDISRYRNLLLDAGVDGRVLVTIAVSLELIGARSYVVSFRVVDGNAPRPVLDALELIADSHAKVLGAAA